MSFNDATQRFTSSGGRLKKVLLACLGSAVTPTLGQVEHCFCRPTADLALTNSITVPQTKFPEHFSAVC